MNKTVLAIIVGIVIIMGTALFVDLKKSPSVNTSSDNNVTVVDGKQIIEINAKAGYHPRKSIAKAGIPTIIRFNTNGTFDCSSSIRIPSMNISQALPQTGSTDIDIGTQKVSIFQGMCGMGMYPFEIDFQS